MKFYKLIYNMLGRPHWLSKGKFTARRHEWGGITSYSNGLYFHTRGKYPDDLDYARKLLYNRGASRRVLREFDGIRDDIET